MRCVPRVWWVRLPPSSANRTETAGTPWAVITGTREDDSPFSRFALENVHEPHMAESTAIGRCVFIRLHALARQGDASLPLENLRGWAGVARGAAGILFRKNPSAT